MQTSPRVGARRGLRDGRAGADVPDNSRAFVVVHTAVAIVAERYAARLSCRDTRFQSWFDGG
jgi:hypothetical protein